MPRHDRFEVGGNIDRRRWYEHHEAEADISWTSSETGFLSYMAFVPSATVSPLVNLIKNTDQSRP